MMKKQTNENNFTKRNINEYKFEGKTYDRRMFLWFYLFCDFSVVCILFFLNVSFYFIYFILY